MENYYLYKGFLLREHASNIEGITPGDRKLGNYLYEYKTDKFKISVKSVREKILFNKNKWHFILNKICMGILICMDIYC